ncbi:MAG: hypothetical protein ACRCXE_01375 [Metamycoplasmataceae bacterium]
MSQDKMTFNKKVLISFLKVFFLFFFSMLPIAIHSILPLFITEFFNGVNGSLVAQAINYSQPMLFFSINIIILIIVQVSFIIKSSEKKENFKENKKKIINTGMFVSWMLSFFVAILFVSVMFMYSEFSIRNIGENSNFVKSYSHLYIGIMAIYILFSGISSYFIFMTLESGIKLHYIFAIELFFSILDIWLAVSFLFTFSNDISPVVRISLGTLISTIIKFLVVGTIYKLRVATWKISEMKFDNHFAKEIVRMSWMLSTFMLVYSFNVIMQMILINIISREVHGYIYHEDGGSLIILSRIIIFSLLNLLATIPKSLGRAVNLASVKPISDKLYSSLNQFKKSLKYNFYGLIVFCFLSLLVYIFIHNITDAFFYEQDWTKQTIPLDVQSSIPFPHSADITYFDVIKKFISNAFVISLFAFAAINFSINLRIFIIFNFGRNLSLFLSIIVVFILSYGIISYFLGVYLQSVFPGFIGFSLAQLSYGILSLIITTSFYFKIVGKLLNKNLEEMSLEKLAPFWSHKNILKYFNERKLKLNICLNSKHEMNSSS